MFIQSAKKRIKILQKYKAMIPDPLNRQVNNRVSKERLYCAKTKEINQRHSYFQQIIDIFIYMFCQILNEIQWTSNDILPILFFLVNEQENLQTQLCQQNHAQVGPPARKAPCCRKCHQPMKGHPRSQCPKSSSVVNE